MTLAYLASAYTQKLLEGKDPLKGPNDLLSYLTFEHTGSMESCNHVQNPTLKDRRYVWYSGVSFVGALEPGGSKLSVPSRDVQYRALIHDLHMVRISDAFGVLRGDTRDSVGVAMELAYYRVLSEPYDGIFAFKQVAPNCWDQLYGDASEVLHPKLVERCDRYMDRIKADRSCRNIHPEYLARLCVEEAE